MLTALDLKVWSSTSLKYAVAYLGYNRHGLSHGDHYYRGAKFAWQHLKYVTYVFLKHFCAENNHQLQSCINTVPYLVPVLSIMTQPLWCNSVRHYDMIKMLACHVNKTTSSCYKAIKQSVLLCFRQWDISQNLTEMTPRVWLLCKYLLLNSHRFMNCLSCWGPLWFYQTFSMDSCLVKGYTQ